MDLDPTIDVEKWLVTAEEREKYIGLAMLFSVDHSRFGELLSRLQKYYVKGNHKYPSDMTEAYNILNHYIRYTKQMQYFNYSEYVGLFQ